MNMVLILVISALCILLFTTILVYMSGESGIKSFGLYGWAGFIIAAVYFAKIGNIQYIQASFFSFIEEIALSMAALMALYSLYKFNNGIKEEETQSTDLAIIVVFVIIGFIGLFLAFNYDIFDLESAAVSVISAGVIYYSLSKSIIGKNVAGFISILMGIIYILFWLIQDFDQYSSLKYLMNSISFILIGLGMIIAYFEKSNKEFKEMENNYRVAMESSSDGIWEYNVLNQIVKLPKLALEIMGLNEERLYYKLKKIETYIHKDDIQKFKTSFEKNSLDKTKYYKEQFRIKIKDNEYKYFSLNGKIITNDSDKAMKIIGFVSDITEEKAKEEIIYNAAYIDKTTLLPNSNYIEQEILSENKENTDFSILYIKLLKFENKIQMNGSGSGEDLLNKVIENIKRYLSNKDILARVHEDSFICVLYTSEVSEVKNTADKISRSINNSKIISNYQCDLESVIGIDIFHNDGAEYMDVVKNANLAMEKSLEEKRDYTFYDNSIIEDMEKKNEMINLIQKGIDKQEFKVFYQLQKAGDGSRFIGGEALVRWNSPEKGMISPGQFIPIAEETGQIIDIGEIVLKEACYTGKSLSQSGYKKFYVSVNISAAQLRDENFYKTVKKILSKSDFQPEHLILEMSENIFNGSMKKEMKTLEVLRNMGVKIAVDDFGKGAVSFDYLLNSPIDILKIDKSFVFGMMGSPKKISMIESMISIGKKLGFTVVVQGIETEEQFAIIEKLNCDWMQGFLFSKPEQKIDGKLV
ncbi:EAL domain-containing protein [Clostridium grantii]|uniref:PAS domain S-box-containing protein/diguanylate cyclase (GGDEF) domain-containing protein n=1 Tax=Clostridium grantii DSM 8605 TaxID=1121316 RepID=A0A1M5T0E5_9CLOT|nr:EAL domain-containing protein [Clostridium grantii]SHH44219.1 PAS domain S-box-containing protein/diguanylate cyclase (GGDEF) domain-containing protein [Clostridium grantii DSM 8605]